MAELKPLCMSLEGIGKVYRLYGSSFDRIKESLSPLRRRYSKDFHALTGIDLHVARGETVGIIGPNGSGKSTLLKIICGVTRATTGLRWVDGRISALLELGAGFNPEFSGRRNVVFAGILAGLTRREVDRRMEGIAAFADIGPFLDQPVKNYSSGMLMRLAFAVAVNADPDVLIIDEALSVGDTAFQRKCFARLEEFKGSATIIFVSHDVQAVNDHCDRAVWLESGRIRESGEPKRVTRHYIESVYAGLEQAPPLPGESAAGAASGHSDAEIRVTSARFSDASGGPREFAYSGEEVRFDLAAEIPPGASRASLGVRIKNSLGLVVAGADSETLAAPASGGKIETEISFAWPKLAPGSYAVTVLARAGEREAALDNALVIECIQTEKFSGVVGLDAYDVGLARH